MQLSLRRAQRGGNKRQVRSPSTASRLHRDTRLPRWRRDRARSRSIIRPFRPFDPFDKAQGGQAQDGGLGMATAELDMISRPEWMDLKVGCPFW